MTQIAFEDWKMKYRQRVALKAGVKPECFAETLNMIPDDVCLQEMWLDGEDADEAADEDMSNSGEWGE